MAPWALKRARQGESSRPPRLVRRFALYAGLALVAAAVGAFFFVRYYATRHAEQSAQAHTEYIAAAILPDRLRRSDFDGPVHGRRLAELDRLSRDELLISGALRVKLYNRRGVVVYSSDRGLIGTRPDDFAEIPGIMAGAPVSDVSKLNSEGGSGPDETVLESYVPVSLNGGGPAGVFEVYADYGPIASEARSIFLPLTAGIALLLLILYISFFPILKRVTRTLRDQVEEIEHKAYHDDLTGLPNRALFHQRVDVALTRAEADGTRFAVLLIDLDRFKDVNDTLGHASGDLLLETLAADLPRQMRGADTVARLGGDEFGILALEISDPTAILALAGKLREILSRPRRIDGIELEVDASIGIALYPEHGDDAAALIRRADVAMYRSKEIHAPALYDRSHDHYSPARLALASDLHRAISERELIVSYQGQHDPGSLELRAVEALVRWQHPEHGLLMPDDFIPHAEHTGLIWELTAYVVDEALRQCREWQDTGLALSVAVNISPRDLLDPRLPDSVEAALRRHRVEPILLELEITENSTITDLPRARAVLARLHGLGVRLAIDDYGTGNSSLAYFRRLPIDALKIDRSFVMRMLESPDDAAIVRSTVALAHDLGLVVIAEGVHSAALNAELAKLGCDLVQGYFFGRAMPAEEVAGFPTPFPD
jgi:diguanylate cyclase (GGDEF)-like protein